MAVSISGIKLKKCPLTNEISKYPIDYLREDSVDDVLSMIKKMDEIGEHGIAKTFKEFGITLIFKKLKGDVLAAICKIYMEKNLDLGWKLADKMSQVERQEFDLACYQLNLLYGVDNPYQTKVVV
jgi:hypothetical protein